MVTFHTAYEVDANDYLDVRALCQRFGIEMPSEYGRFETKELRIICESTEPTITFERCLSMSRAGRRMLALTY